VPYRICKSFTVESGHMLMKHPGLCRYPHGHSRTVEIVLEADGLDGRDMVCDFKAITLACREFLARFDHSMALNSLDPMLERLGPMGERVVVFEKTDPTTEVMAKHMYDFLAAELRAGRTYTDDRGHAYSFPPGLRLARVRLSETASSWAEYSA
jgi:6-pyruvoyltetrahydropterin/6-carboxytetrahydropterin synthase